MTAARQRPALGIALIVVMSACFAAMDTTVRWLGAALPVLVMLSARYGAQAAIMAVWLALDRRRSFRSSRPGFQALRGVLLMVTSAFGFFGLQYVPVPEFTAIVLLTPVLVTALAALLLRERVSALRWALVLGCFAGALIVIRPGSGIFGWAVLLPLACACSYAVFQVLTRRLAATESPHTTHFWTGFAGVALLLPAWALAPAETRAAAAALTPAQFGWLAWIGALGTGGHLLLILAVGVAPMATLMPFTYTQIAAAAACGWMVFRQLPDGFAWLGMAVIAACGATSAWLNTRAAAPPPVTADTTAE